MTPTILIWTIGVSILTACMTIAVNPKRRREIDGFGLLVVVLFCLLVLVLTYFLLWGRS